MITQGHYAYKVTTYCLLILDFHLMSVPSTAIISECLDLSKRDINLYTRFRMTALQSGVSLSANIAEALQYLGSPSNRLNTLL